MLLEVRELTKTNRPKRKDRASVDHKHLMVLEVRGKTLFVQNDTAKVVVALTPGDNFDPLLWFLDELQQDIENLSQEQPAKARKTSIPQEHADAVEECLQSLREHPRCALAHFVPSRNIFKVLGEDKRASSFRVTGLNSKQQKNTEPFQRALSLALTFLESEPGNDGEPREEEEPAAQGDSQPSQL